MLEQAVTVYGFTLMMAKTLAADIDADHLLTPPFAGANSPLWILGHLAVVTDYAGKLFGLERQCPREWHVMFGPGSKPGNLQEPLPTKEELLSALERGHQRVVSAIEKVTPEQLAEPQPYELLKALPLPTVGDVLVHMMTSHEGFHLAQLSACRRKLGQPPLI